LAVAEWALEHFAEEFGEVVQRANRGHGRGECVVSGATRGADEEGIRDGVERNPLLKEPTSEFPVRSAYASENARGLDV
jgi:hypothetical protein